jgi:hypothetical protein
MVFDAEEFLKSVAHVKTFWLSSKLNKLRIESYSDIRQIRFISINRDTGLETVVSVPAYVAEDAILHVKTVISVYRAVEMLQEINVGKHNPLHLRIVPSQKDKQHFSLQVSIPHLDFVAVAEKRQEV